MHQPDAAQFWSLIWTSPCSRVGGQSIKEGGYEVSASFGHLVAEHCAVICYLILDWLMCESQSHQLGVHGLLNVNCLPAVRCRWSAAVTAPWYVICAD